MEIKSRAEKAKENLEKMKAEYKQAIKDDINLKARLRRAKKSPKKTKEMTFGNLINDDKIESCVGFVYKIKIDNMIYIGKKSFKSKKDWKYYTSSSENVNNLIKSGKKAEYFVVDFAKSSSDLAIIEQRMISQVWQQLAISGRLSDSLNHDQGNGHYSIIQWAKNNGFWSQLI